MWIRIYAAGAIKRGWLCHSEKLTRYYNDFWQDPIALDVIRGRLNAALPTQYTSVSEFLADLKRMFRGGQTLHLVSTYIYLYSLFYRQSVSKTELHYDMGNVVDPHMQI